MLLRAISDKREVSLHLLSFRLSASLSGVVRMAARSYRG